MSNGEWKASENEITIYACKRWELSVPANEPKREVNLTRQLKQHSPAWRALSYAERAAYLHKKQPDILERDARKISPGFFLKNL